MTMKFDKDTEAYIYEKYLNTLLPVLTKNDPLKTLNIFCENLKVSILKEYNINEHDLKSDEIDNDHSLGWRKIIDDHKYYSYNRDFKNISINAIREIIHYIGKECKEAFDNAIKTFKKEKLFIFRFFELYSFRKYPELSKSYIDYYPVKRSYFDNVNDILEYYLLLEELFPTLKKETKDLYLKWVNDGPDLESYTKNFNHIYGNNPSKEQIKEYTSYWFAEKLSPIYNHVSQNLLSKYDINKDLIEKANPLTKALTGVQVGPISPKSLDDLKKMSLEELVQFLIDYEEPKHSFIFSKIGLGRSLRDLIATKPEEFTDFIIKFIESKRLHIYLSYLLDGFRDAVKNGKSFNWESVFSLCEEILINQTHEISENSIFWKENTLRDIKISIGWLFDTSLKEQSIPFDYKDRLINLLKVLLQDEEPSQDYELENIKNNMSLSMFSLNTIRGIAMNGIIEYSRWFSRNLRTEETQLISSESKLTPELKDILEQHLDTNKDPSYTIRYIYGTYFNTLFYLDREWLKEHLDSIFPLEKDKQEYWEAAWSGFLRFNSISKPIYDILKSQYDYSINFLSDRGLDVKLFFFPIDKYIIHIMILYLNGEIELKSQDSIISKFFSLAPDNLISIGIGYIGRHLKEIKDHEKFNDVLIRLKELWEFRLSETEKDTDKHKRELSNFVYWFINSIFQKNWVISRLKETLVLLNGDIDVHYDVLDKLLDFTEIFPLKVLDCLELIIKYKVKADNLLLFQEKYRVIFEKILRLKNQDVENRIKNVINYLGSRNIHILKDLLNSNSENS